MSESLLRLPEVLRRTGHSESSWYRAMKADPSLRPGHRGRVALWREAVIDRYVQAELERMGMGSSMGSEDIAA